MIANAKKLCMGGFKNFPVAVVGDIMLDHYISGSVDRISPEAPVPIIRVNNEKYVLGGAGNLAMNLAGLGLPVKIFARVGGDEAGGKILELLKSAGIEAHVFTAGATTQKTRVMGGGRQQMIRIDREEIIAATQENIDFILDGLKAGAKSVVMSDYGKGFLFGDICPQIIEKSGLPVFIDPKGKDWERYRGAAMISPNLNELSEVFNANKMPNDDEQIVAAGEAVRRKFGLKHLLVTRSDKGATLIDDGGAHHERASAIEVYDVSGAGDTMLAAAAAFMTAGVSPAESVKIANAAAQIVVGKIGTYAISAAELLKSLSREPENKKIFSRDEARLKIKEWRESGKKVIFTNGCFDILHAGHVDSFARARSLGGALVVGLNSDSSVRRLKGDSRPINDENARARVISALSDVDGVVIFDEDTPEELLSVLRPDVIAKGGDYTPEQVAGRAFAEVVILPILEGYSTTGILRKGSVKPN